MEENEETLCLEIISHSLKLVKIISANILIGIETKTRKRIWAEAGGQLGEDFLAGKIAYSSNDLFYDSKKNSIESIPKHLNQQQEQQQQQLLLQQQPRLPSTDQEIGNHDTNDLPIPNYDAIESSPHVNAETKSRKKRNRKQKNKKDEENQNDSEANDELRSRSSTSTMSYEQDSQPTEALDPMEEQVQLDWDSTQLMQFAIIAVQATERENAVANASAVRDQDRQQLYVHSSPTLDLSKNCVVCEDASETEAIETNTETPSTAPCNVPSESSHAVMSPVEKLTSVDGNCQTDDYLRYLPNLGGDTNETQTYADKTEADESISCSSHVADETRSNDVTDYEYRDAYTQTHPWKKAVPLSSNFPPPTSRPLFSKSLPQLSMQDNSVIPTNVQQTPESTDEGVAQGSGAFPVGRSDKEVPRLHDGMECVFVLRQNFSRLAHELHS
jgi:hypothetical protein